MSYSSRLYGVIISHSETLGMVGHAYGGGPLRAGEVYAELPYVSNWRPTIWERFVGSLRLAWAKMKHQIHLTFVAACSWSAAKLSAVLLRGGEQSSGICAAILEQIGD